MSILRRCWQWLLDHHPLYQRGYKDGAAAASRIAADAYRAVTAEEIPKIRDQALQEGYQIGFQNGLDWDSVEEVAHELPEQ